MSRRLMNQISGRSEWDTKLGTSSSPEEPSPVTCLDMLFLSTEFHLEYLCWSQ